MGVKKSISFSKIFMSVYLPADKNYLDLQARIKSSKRKNEPAKKYKINNEIQYSLQPAVMLTSFLAVPNDQRKGEKNISLLSLFKNFIGWEDDVHPLKVAFNLIFKMPLYVCYHSLILLPKLILNVARLVTELPWKYLDELCLRAAENARKKNNKMRAWFLQFGSVIFTGLLFLGRAITSPVENIVSTWRRIQDIAIGQSKSEIPLINFMLRGNPIFGKILGVILCGLSLSLTAAFYTFVAIKAAPAVISQASQIPAISSFIKSAVVFLNKTIFQIGMAIPIKTFLNAKIIGAYALTGLSTVAAVAVDRWIFPLGKKIKQFFESLGKNYIDSDSNLPTPTNSVSPSPSTSQPSSPRKSIQGLEKTQILVNPSTPPDLSLLTSSSTSFSSNSESSSPSGSQPSSRQGSSTDLMTAVFNSALEAQRKEPKKESINKVSPPNHESGQVLDKIASLARINSDLSFLPPPVEDESPMNTHSHCVLL